jgi:hypothetical protein
MMKIKKEIVIDADVKKVWKAFSDLERWPEWSGYILRAKWLTSRRWENNSRFTQTIKGFFVFNKFVSFPKIIDVEPYRCVTWTGTRRLIRGIHTLKFEKINKITKVTNLEFFRGPLAAIIFPLVKNKFNLYFKQFLEGLKRECEK